MKLGTNLALAPHVFIALLGKFKGELGFKYHLMALASTTSSGIELRWWIETLIKIREEEGCVSGPAFGGADGVVALMREYDEILHYFLETIQKNIPNSLQNQTTYKRIVVYHAHFVKPLKEELAPQIWTLGYRMQ
jgi:hypothetical protein